MLGCKKPTELDSTLQKVKNISALFGGLEVILVGDFAQLPPVRQEPILDAMVNSTSVYTDPSELSLATTALMQRFRKFDLTEFNRSKSCKLLSSLLTRLRDFSIKGGSFTVDDIKQIGFLTDKTLQPNLVERPILVTTRKEKDAATVRARKSWAKMHNVPIYYWHERPTGGVGSLEDADNVAEDISSRSCAVKRYYIEGAPCLLNRKSSPSSGFVKGTRGNMIGIVCRDGNILPTGRAGELIQIEPPEHITVQVADGKGITTTVADLDMEYNSKAESRTYNCLSSGVNLAFALSVQELQGQDRKEKDQKFIEAPFLVATRKEKKCLYKECWYNLGEKT